MPVHEYHDLLAATARFAPVGTARRPDRPTIASTAVAIGVAILLNAAATRHAFAGEECGAAAPGGAVTCSAANSSPISYTVPVGITVNGLVNGPVNYVTSPVTAVSIAPITSQPFDASITTVGPVTIFGNLFIDDRSGRHGNSTVAIGGQTELDFESCIGTACRSGAVSIHAFGGAGDSLIHIAPGARLSSQGKTSLSPSVRIEHGQRAGNMTVINEGVLTGSIEVSSSGEGSGNISILNRGDIRETVSPYTGETRAANIAVVSDQGYNSLHKPDIDIQHLAGTLEGSIVAITPGDVRILVGGKVRDDVLVAGRSGRVETLEGAEVRTIAGGGSQSTEVIHNGTARGIQTDSATIQTGRNSLIDGGGIMVESGWRNARIESGGVISTSDNLVDGISAAGLKVEVNQPAGTVSTQGDRAHGVYAAGFGFDYPDPNEMIVRTAGEVHATGKGSSAIRVEGGARVGIVQVGGKLWTEGESIPGFIADLGVCLRPGPPRPPGEGGSCYGPYVVNVPTFRAAAIQVVGSDVTNVSTASEVSARGAGTDAINIEGGTATIALQPGSQVTGGRGSGAGIRLENGQTANVALSSGAFLGALSDIALRNDGLDFLGRPGTNTPVTLSNSGTITGTVLLRSGKDSFTNEAGGLWAMRNFAATRNPDVRDTFGEALSDFGGGSTTFVNHGTVALAPVAGHAGQLQARIVNLKDFVNAGTVSLADRQNGGSAPAAGDRFILEGNYVGRNGRLVLDTVLGADGAATDQLVVRGNTSGNTGVLIRNAGGAGAATLQGIQVVQVDGQSAAGSFALAAPVQQGAYEYFLFQGAPGAAADPVSNNDWYLRSQFQTPVDPNPPAIPAPTVLRNAIPGYAMGQQATQEAGLAFMDGLHRRSGGTDQYTSFGTADGSSGANGASAWGRIRSQSLRMDGKHQFGMKQNLSYAQFGKDLLVTQGSDADAAGGFGRVHTGVSLTLGDSSARFGDRARSRAGLPYDTGKMDSRTGALGIYNTRYNSSGDYIDLVGQVQVSRNRYEDRYGTKATQRVVGLGLSVEYGRPRAIGNSRWMLEPQAQLSYLTNRYSRFTDAFSNVEGFSADSLRGRVGARLAWNDTPVTAGSAGGAARPDPRASSFYLSLDAVHDFLRPETVTISGVPVDERAGQRSWLQAGVGGQLALGRSSALYGAVQYQHALGGGSGLRRDGWLGQLGLRYAW